MFNSARRFLLSSQMASARLLASEISTALGILILECLLRFARDRSSALVLAALCLQSSIQTIREWFEGFEEKPKLKLCKMYVVHLFYCIATLVCSCMEFLKIAGYEAILGHFQDVPLIIAIVIPCVVSLELLVLLIKRMTTASTQAAGVNAGSNDPAAAGATNNIDGTAGISTTMNGYRATNILITLMEQPEQVQQ